MRLSHLASVLVLLALVLPASAAQAGGVVDVCDEAHLTAALSGGGTVTFSCSGTITLTNTITIEANKTIDGSGQTVTLSGGSLVRVFTVNSGVTLNLNELTITGGRAPSGGGSGGAISGGSGSTVIVSKATFSGNTAPTGGGGAIFFPSGSLTITDSTFSANSSKLGGAISSDGGTVSVTGSSFTGNGSTSTDGGAINSSDTALTLSNCSFESNTGNEGGAMEVAGGTVTVTGSTFFDNSAGFYGGAFDIFPSSVVVIDKSTIDQNRASLEGGGIFNNNSSLTLANSTVWGNLGTNEGGGIANGGGGTVTVVNSTIAGNGGGTGGGISNSSGTVTLKNTIVANSSSGGNCSGTIANGGGNISYPDATCPGAKVDPLLDVLQDNGGPTSTMSLIPGSPAIDAGNDAICAAAPVNGLDQRGITRAGQGSHCDIGAYEVAYYRVTKTQDDNGECTATDCSLREAIIATDATPGYDGIIVPAGTYQLTLATPSGGQDGPGTGDLDIKGDLTIQGEGAGAIVHQSTGDRVFEIPRVAGLLSTVKMSNLTIENGSVSTSSSFDFGGGILNRGDLTLLSCTVRNNSAGEQGGGIYSDEYSLTVQDSTFSGNTATNKGGGIYNHLDGDLTVTNSTFSGNRATKEDGGGICNVGNLTLSNSTFSGNTTDEYGYGGGIMNLDWAKMTNSTFFGNTAAERGGGFANAGGAELINVTFSGNGAPSGGAIYNAQPATFVKLTNTIAANSTTGANCAGAVTDGGGNLSYPDATCGGINLNPLLGALQNNGGPTQTMALGDGSAALDAGNTAGCQDAQIDNRDQRGNPRFADGDGDTLAWCDIGAHEAQSLAGYPQWDGGQAFTCEVKPDGAVACWGRNKEGQATAPSGAFTQVSAGGYHACTIRSGDSKVTCWGSNSIPVKSCVSETCDTIYIDTGQARPPDGAFIQITAGAYHTCGLKFDGSVDCWGSNINENQKSIGQAQDQAGPFSQISAGMWHNCAVRQADGSVECWGDTADGKATPPAGVTFAQVVAGANHTCGLKPDGSVACWGGNTWGQAPKTRTGPYKEIRAGDLFTCGLLSDGTLDCWGYNFYGQTKEPEGVLTTFGLGDAHGCATLDSNDEWICWGRNDQGQAPDNPDLPPGTGEREDNLPVVQIFLTPARPDGPQNSYSEAVTVEPQASDDTAVAELRCALDPTARPRTFDDLPEEPCPFLGGARVAMAGPHTFYAAAMDVWGNRSAPVSTSFKIHVNSTGLTSLEKKVDRRQAFAGSILHYQLKVRNLTPTSQPFEVTDVLPEGVTYLRGGDYDPDTRTVTWKDMARPNAISVLQLWVRVDRDLAEGTVILNQATLVDGGSGGSASAATVVRKPPPPQGRRADVEIAWMMGD
jgi:CSLREA domain-containing protein